MKLSLQASLILATITLASMTQQSQGYWVGPVWGYDGADNSDDYTFDEKKRQMSDGVMMHMKRIVFSPVALQS